MLGEAHPGLLEKILPVHEEGRLAVEGDCVEVVLVRERLGDAGDQVALVVRRVLAGSGRQVFQPVVRGPERHLVGADGGEVELPAVGRYVLRDRLAQLVLWQDRELDLDVGVLLGELGGQLLEIHHLGVVDGRHRERCSAGAATTAAAGSQLAGGSQERDHDDRGHPGQAQLASLSRATRPKLWTQHLTHPQTPSACTVQHTPSKAVSARWSTAVGRPSASPPTMSLTRQRRTETTTRPQDLSRYTQRKLSVRSNPGGLAFPLGRQG